MNVRRISIIICTYNRAAQLRETLAAINDLAVDAFDVEAVVVDNNSTDLTTVAVFEAAGRARFPIRYVREPHQGKSFALNRGLDAATGDVLALTDDDVWPRRDWLLRIAAAFRTHPIVFAFGKVLPRWEDDRRARVLDSLAQDVWGPLALVDYGDRPVLYEPEIPGLRLPIGANLAIRRDTVVAIGGWRTDLGKVDNSLVSGEDHEIFCRLREHGHFHGIYDPQNVVRHFVPSARTRRRYFWQWFYWNGKTAARMADALYHPLDLGQVPLVAGAPRFLYRQTAEQAGKWLTTLARGQRREAFVEELRTIYYAGLIAQCWSWWRDQHRDPGRVPSWMLRRA